MALFHRDGRFLLALMLAACLPPPQTTLAQLPDEPAQIESEATRRLRATKESAAKASAQPDRLRPPFEFYRTQVAPFDVLPYVKPNHWVTMTEELQANNSDYLGQIQTAPIQLLSMPKAVAFGRDARLLKETPSRLSFQALLPRKTKEIDLDLVSPGALRPDVGTQALLRPLETHQMLIVVLAENPSSYANWVRYQALIPANAELDDPPLVDLSRYYRLVLYQESAKPNLSSHPLTWTTISHILWDDLDPSVLNVGQRQALLDWLHWGGQLIVAGGPGKTLALLSDAESFLSPYLPAFPSGENDSLAPEDLRELALRFPAPGWRFGSATFDEIPVDAEGAPPPSPRPRSLDSTTELARRYRGPFEIVPPPNRPVYLAGLRPRGPQAQAITTGPGAGRVIAYEHRVGRGRILVLGFDPKEPAFLTWKGYDTFVRRVLLRRPEDPWEPTNIQDRSMLPGPDLSWVRYVARDLGAERVSGDPESTPDQIIAPAGEDPLPKAPVAAWLDAAGLPDLARKELTRASGIEVPGSSFVLRVMVAYILALVPVNWLVCRFLLRRKELAWVFVPLLSLGVAGAVERAAAFDIGYDLACDEIDVLELQPGYPRGHLSRFAALYSTGRERFTISFPGDPSALALPLNTNLSLRGESVTESSWLSAPLPALTGFRVEPRSLSMFRAEQMIDVGSGIGLVDGPERQILNQTDLELLDAVLVDVGSPGNPPTLRHLGPIKPGQAVNLNASLPATPLQPLDWIDLNRFLDPLQSYFWAKPADQGELRLVAWTPRPLDGHQIDPKVDRHRGFTLVVVHLAYGPPPSPDGPVYDRSGGTRAASLSPLPDPNRQPTSSLAAGPFPSPALSALEAPTEPPRP